LPLELKERLVLKAIQRRLFSIITLFSVLMLVLLIAFVIDELIFEVVESFYILLSLVYILILILFIRENNRYILAKLIVENKILCIPVVEVAKKSPKADFINIPLGGIDIYISCFGILLGSRVIKFNIDGVALKKVEVGNDFICISYGKGKKNRIIKLIHGVIGADELQCIAEQFRYETGIVPIVVKTN
jgi:hypothetical protein